MGRRERSFLTEGLGIEYLAWETFEYLALGTGDISWFNLFAALRDGKYFSHFADEEAEGYRT